MAALSSMMRMRRLGAFESCMGTIFPSHTGQFEDECGAPARAVAFSMQGSSQLLSRECAAVQAKTMPRLSSRKAMGEQAVHIFRRDANPVVDDRDAYPLRRRGNTQDDDLLGLARLVAGILGVAHQIDENLQHLVLIDRNGWYWGELTLQGYAVARKGAGVEPETILHEVDNLDSFRDSAEFGVALLHRHGLLDVFEVIAQRTEFLQRHLLVGRQLQSKGGQIFGYAL